MNTIEKVKEREREIEGIRKLLTISERNITEGRWEDQKGWKFGVGQHRKMF